MHQVPSQSRNELWNSIQGPPPPPPPPPPVSVLPNQKIPIKQDTTSVQDLCDRMITEMIKIGNDVPAILLSMYHHCDPVIQSGPTCGLVALIMCLKLVDEKNSIDLPEILDKAQSRGYTKFGEMFSAENMYKFIRDEFHIKCDLKINLERSMLELVRHLCQGLPVLVPYDADANYEPCLKNGTRAHWAILCGFCIPASGSIDDTTVMLEKSSKLINGNLVHLNGKNWRESFEFIKRHLILDRLWVYARQGKSPRLQLWNFRQLCQSNQNLNHVSCKILNDPERATMIYPENGRLDQSLSNHFLLIHR